jgi:replicative DNA helicase
VAIATHARTALDDILADTTSRARLNRIGDLIDGHIDLLEARAEGQHGGIPTGWLDLDRLIGGLRPGQVAVICGRPGMAKSAVALCLAINAAHEGHETLVASIEMSDEELMDRTVASEARVALQNIRNGKTTPKDWERIAGHVQALSELPLWILDDPTMTVPDIQAKARRIGAQLIVVDYLQILTASGGRSDDNRQVEVSGMSAAIKRMARQLEVPVVVLSQLNRAVESRMDKRPMLADLRESGAIEQDADLVIGLYRDEYYKPDSKDKGIIEMDVLKQRNGPTGVAKLAFASQWVKVQNLAVV